MHNKLDEKKAGVVKDFTKRFDNGLFKIQDRFREAKVVQDQINVMN